MINNRTAFLRHQGQTSGAPLMLEVEKAEGIWLYTPEGKGVMDLISGIGVSNLGHCHPAVVAAVQAQAQQYMHVTVYGEAILSPQAQLAASLAGRLPDPIDACYFVNSGSEAAEAAIKLAKRATGRHEIISCVDAYHGSTHGALSAMGNEHYRQAYRPLLPGFRHIRYGNFDDLLLIGPQTAGVLIEAVQGEAGVIAPPRGYLTALAARCKEQGALFMLDEVQTGFGRTGKQFAFEHEQVVPDAVMFAKGLGFGMPIGALCAASSLLNVFASNPILGHITTFGGHPVSCAASLAGLAYLDAHPELIAECEAKGQLLASLVSGHHKVKSIRQIGLMMAVEVGSFERVDATVRAGLEEGVMLDPFLYCSTAFRLAPPLIISTEEIYDAAGRIARALDRIA